MSSLVGGPSSLVVDPHSQRTTPDVLRPAAGADSAAATPHGAVGGGAGPGRRRRHHRRRARSPAYHRPCSAASGAQRLSVPRRKNPRHSVSKSDFEVPTVRPVDLLLGRRGSVVRPRWLGSRVVSVLDSGAEGPGFKSQPPGCRVTVLGKLFTPIVPLFTKQRNWQQPS